MCNGLTYCRQSSERNHEEIANLQISITEKMKREDEDTANAETPIMYKPTLEFSQLNKWLIPDYSNLVKVLGIESEDTTKIETPSMYIQAHNQIFSVE